MAGTATPCTFPTDGTYSGQTSNTAFGCAWLAAYAQVKAGGANVTLLAANGENDIDVPLIEPEVTLAYAGINIKGTGHTAIYHAPNLSGGSTYTAIPQSWLKCISGCTGTMLTKTGNANTIVAIDMVDIEFDAERDRHSLRRYGAIWRYVVSCRMRECESNRLNVLWPIR